jgi:hypothetical protein
MAPEKMPLPAVIVSVWAPRFTVPVPVRALIEVPLAAEMSKVPLSARLAELAMLPLPYRESVPAVMVVIPV